MKSTGPILMLLSNSGEGCDHDEKILPTSIRIPTHHSLLAKEDIDNGDVFVPGVVKLTLRREHHQYPNFEILPLTLK